MVSPGYHNVVLFRYKYGEIDVTVINANVDDAMIFYFKISICPSLMSMPVNINVSHITVTP